MATEKLLAFVLKSKIALSKFIVTVCLKLLQSKSVKAAVHRYFVNFANLLWKVFGVPSCCLD